MNLKTLKNSVILCSVSISIVSILLLGFYVNLYHTKQIETLSNEKLVHANNVVIEKISNYLMPAVKMAETSAYLFENYVLYYTLPLQLEFYTLSIIKPFPQLASAYFGDNKGNFIMTKRLLDKTLETRIVNTRKKTTTLKKYNLFNSVISTKTEKKVYFDPRKRPWYIGTKKKEAAYWTNVYTFFSDKKPGITAGYPIFNKKNQFYGVFGIDIRLQKIGEFLDSHNFSEKSSTFIINDKNKIVIKSNSVIANEEGSQIGLNSINRINEKVVEGAFKGVQTNTNHKFKLTFDNVLYYVVVSDFPKLFGNNWKLVTVAPRSDVIPSYLDQKSTFYSMGFFILLFIGLMGTLLANKLVSYFTTIAYDLKNIKNSQTSVTLTTQSLLPEVRAVITELERLNR